MTDICVNSKLTNDTVRARNLDLLPAGMVVKLHLGTIRSSTRGRNGPVDSIRGGPLVEIRVRQIFSDLAHVEADSFSQGAHRNENGAVADVGCQP
jgi:hypothetical protein